MPRAFIRRGSYTRAAAPGIAVPYERRKRVWARTIESNTDLALDVTYDLLSDFRTSAGITINLPGVTIGRVRIKIQVHLDFSVTAGSSSHGVVAGVYTQSQQSSGGRLQASSDLIDDYLYWGWHPASEAGEFFTVGTATDQSYCFEIDSKAMRKMDEVGMGLFLNLATTGSINMVGSTIASSVLLILP